jgi:IMP dehydrogenase
MNDKLSFDDVLLEPNFSFIKSRKDVSLEQNFMDYRLGLPIISSNMDTITGSEMANAMARADAVGALYRFCTIEENVKMFKEGSIGGRLPMVSVGLGGTELERAEALYAEGARHFIIDVAHGASMEVVRQYQSLNCMLPDIWTLVGNFATGKTIEDFEHHCGHGVWPQAYKIGIGGGSMCTTRVVTGCGMPTFASILDCAKTRRPIVADGGMRNSGDIAKALAAGASAVMLGSLLAGTDETPGKLYDLDTGQEVVGYSQDFLYLNIGKKYRGSASRESYEVQGKTAAHRAPEGEATTVPYKGPVKAVIEELVAGVRSAMSYVGAENLQEFREKAKFLRITNAGAQESRAHGVKK